MPLSRRAVVLVGAVIAVLAVAPAATPTGVAPKLPDDFEFVEGKYSPGPVVFSHKQHYEKVGQCQTCHLRIFSVKKGTALITFRNITAGKYCGACHDGKTQFRETVVFHAHDKQACGRCHKE